ncbi:peptidase C13 [Dyella sp. A6]|uniref:peptidase C13 n=1 Tax=Dyella aluminiiresistens TaxID=3069105 RepID=UPI002E75D2DF|nr:peptidase C13 [Dyella sp. A6]
MKITVLCLFLILTTTSAVAADSFSARVQNAKRIENSAVGKAYQTTLWDHIGHYGATVMTACFNNFSSSGTKPFTVVANILPNRTLSQVEVRPETKIAQCFINGFKHAPFPAPPASFGKSGIPIEIDMSIEP